MNEKTDSSKRGLTYADSGVDIDAGNDFVAAIKPLVKSTRRKGVMGAIGGFGGLFDLRATGFDDPVLVAANDGVGTKLKLAFETGIHHTVGVDLVAMCVNDLVVQGAEPLFFLDYFATGRLETGVAQEVVQGIARGCRQAGCALIGGETAEMPGMYAKGEYDLAGFAVGAVERSLLLPQNNIGKGDIVVALPSGGLHSNGFSLVRKIVETGGHDLNGPFARYPDYPGSLGELLLAPTRIYVRALLAARQNTGKAIKAMAHITGGGLSENIPRVLPDDLAVNIDLDKLNHGNTSIVGQSLFGWLADEGGIAAEEMLRTFNCGVGMVLIVDHHHSDNVMKALADAGETSFVLGELIPRQGESPVCYSGRLEFAI